MANDMIKSMFNETLNMAVLSVKPTNAAYGRKDTVISAGERFIQLAALLEKEQFVCLQINRGKDGKSRSCIFSSKDAKVNSEDFEWIFRDCAEIGTFSEASSVIRQGTTNWIYELRRITGYSVKQHGSCINKSSNNNDSVSWKYFRQMLNEMGKTDATVWIGAGVTQEGMSTGAIAFGLPDEMSLRMKTMISMAYPNTKISKISESAENLSDNDITMECLLGSVTGALEALMDEWYKEEMVKKEQDVFDEPSVEIECNAEYSTEETGVTPIDDLELSVRAYNCLKRAGINTIEELRCLNDEDYFHIRNLSRRSIDEIKQKLSEFETLTEESSITPCRYTDMLEELIGLKEVKEQVQKITAFVRMKQDMKKLGIPESPTSFHMEFAGNPGTAKTTVARILAGIFYEEGLLRSKELVEVSRADLVSEYVGQTAGKVKSVFQRAKGKLLFIDEAYSLVDDRKGSFGDEAINTIVQEMENSRNDTVVIFAGYPDKMKDFFSKNPGLRSRVPFHIHFADYTAEEMLQIAKLETTKRGFSFGTNVPEAVLNLCKKALHYPDAGNGRFCRNLVENAIFEYALRNYGPDEEENKDKKFILQEEDFVLPEMMQEMKCTVSFGFRVS